MTSLAQISDFGFEVTVTRRAAGSYVDGYWVDGASTPTQVMMSIQPLSGSETLLLSEGERTRAYCKAYSPIELLAADQTTQARGDIVTDTAGIDWEVQRVSRLESFNSSIAPHWKLILAKVNPK